VFTPRPVSSVAAIPPGNGAAGTASLPDLTKPVVVEPAEPAKDAVPVVSFIAESVEATAPPTVKIETPAVEVPKPAVVPKPDTTPKPAAAPRPAATPKPAVAPKSAVTQRPAPKPEGAYWVQIGSYAKKSGADKVKATLSERGLVSVIFDSEVQGITYYRVRVGPYVSRSEADYWLRLVKAMDGYENSLVWKSGT
jgi:DedD protein